MDKKIGLMFKIVSKKNGERLQRLQTIYFDEPSFMQSCGYYWQVGIYLMSSFLTVFTS